MTLERLTHPPTRLLGVLLLAAGLLLAATGTPADASRRVTVAEVEQAVGLPGMLLDCDEEEFAAGATEICAFALGGATAAGPGDGVGVLVTRMPLAGPSEPFRTALLDRTVALPPELVLTLPVRVGERAPLPGPGDWAVGHVFIDGGLQVVSVVSGQGNELVVAQVLVRLGRDDAATLLDWAAAVATLALGG